MKVIEMPDMGLMADSAIVMPGRPLFIPDFSSQWLLRLVVALRVSRLGKDVPQRFAHRYFDAITLCARLTAADAPSGVNALFDGALSLGRWIETYGLSDPLPVEIDGRDIMPLSGVMDTACSAITATSRYATLKTGDIILLRTVVERPDVAVGQELKALLAGRDVLDLRIR